MALPLALLPYATPPYTKMTSAGLVPNSFGYIYAFVTGTATPLPTYQDQNGDSAHSHPIVLDANGFPPAPIYILPEGYELEIQDSDHVVIPVQSIDFVEDVGSAFLAQQAVVQTQGTETVTTPYIVLTTDNFVIVGVAAPGSFVVQLPAAADRGTPLVIKNLSANAISVSQDGTETIDSLTAAYSLPAASSPLFPTITILSNGVSGWLISGGIGV